MTEQEKLTIFEKETEWIQSPDIRGFVRIAIAKLPDYFFQVAASSTGKYHPSYALGEGGLVRHTKAAVAIAKDLLGLEMYSAAYNQRAKDIILASLILHDGMKHGLVGGKFTVATHPTLMAKWLKDDVKIHDYLPDATCDQMLGAISAHMGQFNTDYKTNEEILPKPATKMERFVHQCDYLASRKYLEVNFDAINYTGDRV